MQILFYSYLYIYLLFLPGTKATPMLPVQKSRHPSKEVMEYQNKQLNTRHVQKYITCTNKMSHSKITSRQIPIRKKYEIKPYSSNPNNKSRVEPDEKTIFSEPDKWRKLPDLLHGCSHVDRIDLSEQTHNYEPVNRYVSRNCTKNTSQSFINQNKRFKYNAQILPSNESNFTSINCSQFPQQHEEETTSNSMCNDSEMDCFKNVGVQLRNLADDFEKTIKVRLN